MSCTGAAERLTGLPGPTGYATVHPASGACARTRTYPDGERMAPFPRPACLSSREGRPVTPANTIEVGAVQRSSAPLLTRWRGTGTVAVLSPPCPAARLSSPWVNPGGLQPGY
jgi:hypothetical protein